MKNYFGDETILLPDSVALRISYVFTFPGVAGAFIQMSVRQLKEKMMLEFRQTGKQPVYLPDKFEQFCKDNGAHLLFSSLIAAQTERRHTSERVLINKRRTVALLYQLCYGLSQQCKLLAS